MVTRTLEIKVQTKKNIWHFYHHTQARSWLSCSSWSAHQTSLLKLSVSQMFLNRRFLAPGTIDVWGFQATHSLAANKKQNYGNLFISNSLTYVRRSGLCLEPFQSRLVDHQPRLEPRDREVHREREGLEYWHKFSFYASYYWDRYSFSFHHWSKYLDM